MGFFGFLTKKLAPVQPIRIIPANRPEADISKTYIIVQLFKTPRDGRDDKWRRHFFENVATASFTCATPQVLTGPDGFPYFILCSPVENQPFESFCIKNMAEDFLLDRGWGIVFNPTEGGSADWVFTHGDVVNLHLNNHFFSPPYDASIDEVKFTKNIGVTTKEEQVMVAQPSDNYLPSPTRHALKNFLKSRGINKPKLLMLSSINGEKIIRKLAFNIDPKNYPVVSELDHLMQEVGWFLPNDYIIIPLPANSELAMGFNDM
ncbi:MAG: hypothetical protein WKI04_04390 [Ferruginibacter sp.]